MLPKHELFWQRPSQQCLFCVHASPASEQTDVTFLARQYAVVPWRTQLPEQQLASVVQLAASAPQAAAPLPLDEHAPKPMPIVTMVAAVKSQRRMVG